MTMPEWSIMSYSTVQYYTVPVPGISYLSEYCTVQYFHEREPPLYVCLNDVAGGGASILPMLLKADQYYDAKRSKECHARTLTDPPT